MKHFIRGVMGMVAWLMIKRSVVTMMIKRRINSLCVLGFIGSMALASLTGCGSSDGSNGPGAQLYGVPADVSLNGDCPFNGSWETDTPNRIAKTNDAAMYYFPSRFDGQVSFHDWLFDVELMEWTKTGACMQFLYVYACDYYPYYSGEIVRGYVDPMSEEIDENGHTRYTGYTTDGLIVYVIINDDPEVLHVRVDPDGDGGFHYQTLYPEP